MDWICFRCGKIYDTYKELSEHSKNCEFSENSESLKKGAKYCTKCGKEKDTEDKCLNLACDVNICQ